MPEIVSEIALRIFLHENTSLNNNLLETAYLWPHTTPHDSWDNSVGTATGYVLDDRGVDVRVLVGSRIFTSPRRPDRL
jgi:hypothetical protein